MLNWIKSLFGSGSSSTTTTQAVAEKSNKKTGVIRYFNHKKGFGFIESPQTETDVFVHVKDVDGRLRKGDQVRFHIVEETKGPRATQVEVV